LESTSVKQSAFGGRYIYVNGQAVLKKPEIDREFDAENPGAYIVEKAAEARALLAAAKMRATLETEYYRNPRVSLEAAVIWIDTGADDRIGVDIAPQMYSDVLYGVRESRTVCRRSNDLSEAARTVVSRVDALLQTEMLF
jgi:hypothetical protein